MSPIRLSVRHLQQPREGECLAACTAMVLNYLDVNFSYNRLVRILKIQTDYGTASSNIHAVSRFGVRVTYRQGNLQVLREHLESSEPCIVFVKTGELPYWQRNIDHAVVVVGIDESQIYLNDPDLPTAPTRVPLGDFDLAWLEHDEMYAVITK